MTAPFVIEPYRGQDRTGFACGNDRIDTHFCERLSREIRSDYARCQVAIYVETGKIAGLYTVSSQHIPLTDLPVTRPLQDDAALTHEHLRVARSSRSNKEARQSAGPHRISCSENQNFHLAVARTTLN